MLSSRFLSVLRNPPKEFRPIPFWSWNERLDVAETRRQIAEMDRVGIGGYFMHARGGLQTPYMGPEWMANIEAGVEEGRARGMGAWAYDENGWPSGFGNGLVNGQGEAFRQKYLRMRELAAGEEAPTGDRTITVVTAADGRRLLLTYDVNPFYVDTLDAAVTRTFLDEIYEPYLERFGKDFGGAMPGFFTDEPQVSRNGIPWSLTLPAAYADAYDEDLLPILPELFLQTGNYERTRYRFWHLVQELFVENFTRQIFDWCEKHGAKLTGHMVLEETFHSQITSNSAVMPHYEFFHIPGMDWLGRHIEPPTTPLQVASVAHQLGKKHILSETFALTGWNVLFDELKWMYEWQMVRGVTLLCQHLEGYSLRGIRKRDYPPSLFYQQPWWDDYRAFNDAVSRIGMLLAEGKPACRALVIHPQASSWMLFDNAANAGIGPLFAEFMEVTRALEESQVPFHYGDERILRRHGSVAGPLLRVGLAEYDAVILPHCLTLAAETDALLRQFAEAGGTIIAVNQAAPSIAGDPDARADALLRAATMVPTPANVPEALPECVRLCRVTADDAGSLADVQIAVRDLPAELAGSPLRMVYAVNRSQTRDAAITLRTDGVEAARFVPESGDVVPAVHEQDGGALRIPAALPRGGSAIFFVSAAAGVLPHVAPTGPPSRTPLPAALLAGEWELELKDPNALVLDMCEIRFDGELVAESDHVSVVQKRALDLGRPVRVSLAFTVETEPGYQPPADAFLVLETPERFAITVNGTAIPNADAGFYRDTAFRKVPTGGSLRAGVNRIVLETTFRQPDGVYENLRRAAVFEAEKNKLTYDSEIEAAYLVGSFGVTTAAEPEPLPRRALRLKGPFRLGPLPTRANPENLTACGLPFFNGTACLRKTVTLGPGEAAERALVLSDKQAHVARIGANGKTSAKVLWRPYDADLAGMLREGRNTVELTLTSGLRNLLGPHHQADGESYAVAPACFFKEPNIWGHTAWNDGYCLVEFGVRF